MPYCYIDHVCQLILLIGNYMNGTGVKGGAFGFRISSINKVQFRSDNLSTPDGNLVSGYQIGQQHDTASFPRANGGQSFPSHRSFPRRTRKTGGCTSRYAYQYKQDMPNTSVTVNLVDVRKGFAELRDGLKLVREELTKHFANIDPTDRYGTQMWAFINKAKFQLDDLADEVKLAETTFSEVVSYYGEEENRNLTSSEFFRIFKVFTTSYQVGLHFILSTPTD